MLKISIHAPSRERLKTNKKHIINPEDFNPRSLTGATTCHRLKPSANVKFQSTLPHGSDKKPSKSQRHF